MEYHIREQNLGGVLDEGIRLAKNHFGLFLSILLVVHVPFQLGFGLAHLELRPEVVLPPDATWFERIMAEGEADQHPSVVLLSLVSLPVMILLVTPLEYAVLIQAVSRVYLGEPTTLGQAFRKGLPAFPRLVWTSFLFYLVTMAGFFLLVIPGILFLLWFVLYMVVTVVEGRSGFAALGRSRQLMKGNIIKLIALGVLLWAIFLGVSLGSVFIADAYMSLLTATFLNAVTTILWATVIVVFYYSARCQHENFDLTLLSRGISQRGEEAEPAPETAQQRAET